VVLVLATHNEGKKREYDLLLKDFPIEIRGLSEFKGVSKSAEEGNTFEEIAIKKAQYVSKTIGLPALADDSGLEVDALDGAPGIFSARYAGEESDDNQNNRKLLEALRGKEDRQATFVCSIAISKPTGQTLTYSGRCSGKVIHEPLGANGFGYDPLFFYPPLGKTFAQLSTEEKGEVSHRGRAMRKLRDDSTYILMWLNSP
jgi:XTP/dITP diphosphohydrolase